MIFVPLRFIRNQTRCSLLLPGSTLQTRFVAIWNTNNKNNQPLKRRLSLVFTVHLLMQITGLNWTWSLNVLCSVVSLKAESWNLSASIQHSSWAEFYSGVQFLFTVLVTVLLVLIPQCWQSSCLACFREALQFVSLGSAHWWVKHSVSCSHTKMITGRLLTQHWTQVREGTF